MKTTECITNFLDHLYTNTAWANVGDASGLQPSASAGSLYLSLHTACPGLAGNQTTSEAAYSGYARILVARNSGQWTVASPQVSNATQLSWPQSSSGETEMYVGVGTASAGAGHLLDFGPITTQFYAFSAETSGNFTVGGSAFSVNDRIAFFSSAGVALPTGVTYGTVYWVKTAAADVYTISATMGGGAIVVSGAGGGIACKVNPFVIASTDIPTLAAGQLVLIEA